MRNEDVVRAGLFILEPLTVSYRLKKELPSKKAFEKKK